MLTSMDKNSFYIKLTYRSHQEESEEALHFIGIFQLKLSCLYKWVRYPKLRDLYMFCFYILGPYLAHLKPKYCYET